MLLNFLNGFIPNPTASFVISAVVCAVLAYILGSLNFGIIVSKLLYKEDVRASGSGNAGSTNMLRTYGKKAAAFTFLGDCAKTAIAMGLGFLFLEFHGMFLAGVFCMIGHTYPVFFKFKGGKGVACFAILVLITSISMGMWYIFVILFAIFAIIVIGMKYVSLGSVVCALLYPVLLNRFVELAANASAEPESILILHSFEIYAVLAGLLVVFMHRSNLARLFKGTENKTVLFKKKDKSSKEGESGK